jgi:hypothetical protein
VEAAVHPDLVAHLARGLPTLPGVRTQLSKAAALKSADWRAAGMCMPPARPSPPVFRILFSFLWRCGLGHRGHCDLPHNAGGAFFHYSCCGASGGGRGGWGRKHGGGHRLPSGRGCADEPTVSGQVFPKC